MLMERRLSSAEKIVTIVVTLVGLVGAGAMAWGGVINDVADLKIKQRINEQRWDRTDKAYQETHDLAKETHEDVKWIKAKMGGPRD